MIVTEVALRQRVLVVMVAGALILFGGISFPRISNALFPDVDFPIVTVTTMMPGTDAITMETDVTEVVEEALSSLASVKKLRSETQEGVSQVIVEFELEYDIDIGAQDVRDRIATVIPLLPQEAEAPVIEKFDLDAQPIIAVVLMDRSGDTRRLTDLADDELKNRFQKIRGVGGVRIVGGRKREVRVWLSAAAMRSRGIDIGTAIAALRSGVRNMPGGRLTGETREWSVRTEVAWSSPEEIGGIVVGDDEVGVVYLRDIARVEDGGEEQRTVAQYDGIPAVTMLIRRQSGANILDVADAVRAEVDRVQTELPPGVSLATTRDQSTFIRASITSAQHDLVIGVGLAVLVIFVFLWNVRATLIVAAVIPSSIIGTMACMYFAGFTFNNMTMLALSLSVGILIDDAIVMVETIVRHVQEGDTPLQAAQKGGKRLGFAIVATSVSLCAVFIPVAFTSGLVGRFFFEFGMTVTFAILTSTTGALTLTPMLCAVFLTRRSGDAPHQKVTIMPLVERGFSRFIDWAIRRRGWVIGGGAAIFVASLLLVGKVGKEFVPTADESEFNVQIQFPTGTPIKVAEGALDRMARRLRKVPEVGHVLGTVGGGGGQRIDVAMLSADMVPQDERNRGQLEVMADVRSRFANLQNVDVSVENVPRVSGGGFRSAPINLDIRGPRLDKLEEITAQVVSAMQEVPGIVDVNTSYKAGKPRLEVKVDHARAGMLGVRLSNIGEAVRLFVGGDDVATYEEDGDLHDVVVRLADEEHTDQLMIGEIPVRSRTGVVPVASVARLVEGTGPVQIDHQGQERQITILANVNADTPLQTAVERIQQIITEDGLLPPGYEYGFSGFADLMQESFAAMVLSATLALAIIYMTLASQFNSFVDPLIIMVTLPLSVVGAFGGLYLTGMTLNIFSMIGLVLLAGLVTKTGILVVEFANQLRAEGMSIDEAIQRAAALRLRPILMTTISTIGASLPVAIGLGQGSEQRSPQAVVIIGGLITSTLLTLVILPSVYRILSARSHRTTNKETES